MFTGELFDKISVRYLLLVPVFLPYTVAALESDDQCQ
jgi:hypothetical protein